MKVAQTSQYDKFSRDYHWIYSDQGLTGKPFLEKYRNFLAPLPKGSRVLDCACGIGIQAWVLARLGFSVQGTDASPGMIREARRRSPGKNPNLSFAVCSWRELPRLFPPEFDAAFCLGNSIGHCRDRKELIASLKGIRSVLRNGGRLTLDSRNWEKFIRDKPRLEVFGFMKRNGIRCASLVILNLPFRLQREGTMEVVFVFEQKGRVYYRNYTVKYYPFSYADLCGCLKQAGFNKIQSDYSKKIERYRIIAS